MFSCWYTPLWNDVNGPKNGLNLPHCWGCFLDGERSIQLKGMVFVSIHVQNFPELFDDFRGFSGMEIANFLLDQETCCGVDSPVVVNFGHQTVKNPKHMQVMWSGSMVLSLQYIFRCPKKMGVDDDLQRTGYKWCVLKAKRIEGPCDVPIFSCLFHCPGWLAEHHNRNGWAPSRRSGSDRSHGRTPSSTRPNCQAGDESLGQPHQDEQTNTSPSFVGEVGKALLHFS